MPETSVLIGTGSIGVAIARRVSVGRHLVLADIDDSALQSVSEQLRGEGYTVSTHVTDVSDHGAVAALADAAADLGTVTRVIHAAGVSPAQASTDRVLHVDLAGTAFVLREFGRVIGAGGSGVVIASMAGHMGAGISAELETALATTAVDDLLAHPELQPDAVGDSGAAYTLAKRANAVHVRSESVVWGDRGARLNCISPGIISTPLARDEMTGPNAAGYAAMIDNSAAQRMGTPTDVADLAALIMEPTGSFITGSDFLIDGGVIAAMRTGRL